MTTRTTIRTAVVSVLALVSAAVAQDLDTESPPAEMDERATARAPSNIEAGEASMPEASEALDSDTNAAAASNPLSASSKLDVRLDYYDIDGSSDRWDANIKGDFMLLPRVKFVYEAHYWSTNITGTTEDDWERVSFKPIWFVDDVKLTDPWQMRIAAGAEWIIDFDNADKGIGSGSDQIAPLFGLAFNNRDSGLVLIPLVQHFLSYDGPSVNTTAARLIALQSLPDSMWLKLDTKIPFDWQNNTVPATVEVELGKMITPKWGLYGTGYVGVGGDRPYEWGIGGAVRFRF